MGVFHEFTRSLLSFFFMLFPAGLILNCIFSLQERDGLRNILTSYQSMENPGTESMDLQLKEVNRPFVVSYFFVAFEYMYCVCALLSCRCCWVLHAHEVSS